MTVSGNDIKRLIPQREPFLMIEKCEATEPSVAHTALSVTADNYFILPDATMAETGLLEHIAQSAAALVGMQALQADSKPRIGLIGEVKHYTCHRRPTVGERVETTIRFGLSFGNVTLAEGECRVGQETIAQAQLKIFMQ